MLKALREELDFKKTVTLPVEKRRKVELTSHLNLLLKNATLKGELTSLCGNEAGNPDRRFGLTRTRNRYWDQIQQLVFWKTN